MSQEEPEPKEKPLQLGPDGLPAPEDRGATLTVVVDKQGGYYLNYPIPLHISLEMLAHAQALFAGMIRQEWEAAQAAQAQRRIIVPSLLDPKYQRRQ
jgi:hypothetical protein